MIKYLCSHDNGFACTCCHLICNAWQSQRCIAIYLLSFLNLVEYVLTGIGFLSYFVQPDDSFYSFLLSKKKFFFVYSFRVKKPKEQKFFCYSCGMWILLGSPFSHFGSY